MAERTLFIADAHLQPGERPAQQSALANFLRQAAKEAQRLVLLGDTFHLWFERRGEAVGDYTQALALFAEAAAAGLRIEMVSGNRDFAVGAGTAADAYAGFFAPLGDRTPSVLIRYGIQPRGDRFAWTQSGLRLLACHGDIFCRRLYGYRLLRWLLRNRLSLLGLWYGPMKIARLLANLLQNRPISTLPDLPAASHILSSAVAPEIAAGADIVVCGHVHMHERRRIVAGKRTGELFVVPPWSHQHEYAEMSNGRLEVTCKQRKRIERR